mmetsp:Transcript_10706/g.15282  ORF Transcript_10706/g.15282 Transcript_10706/m.15282 type:complete len:112 (+) Transcript_10706:154-489(+)
MSANDFNNVPPAAIPQNHIIVPENYRIDHNQDNNANANANANGIQEIEDELTPLQLHIENGEWETALIRLRAHPDEILPSSKKHNGRALTALHLACESGECPFPLIVGILS